MVTVTGTVGCRILSHDNRRATVLSLFPEGQRELELGSGPWRHSGADNQMGK